MKTQRPVSIARVLVHADELDLAEAAGDGLSHREGPADGGSAAEDDAVARAEVCGDGGDLIPRGWSGVPR